MWFIGLVMFFAPLIALYQWMMNGFSISKRIVHFSQIHNGKKYVVPLSPESVNPWDAKIASSPLYGQLPGKIGSLMSRMTADDTELIVGSVWATHDVFKLGYLIATSEYIRWVQVFPTKSDEFWQYNTRVFIDSPTGRTLTPLVINGEVFELRGITNFGKAKKFKKLIELVQQSILHDAKSGDHPNSAPQAATQDGGVDIHGLERLAALRKSGALSVSEYESAKKQLLGRQ